MERVSHAQPYGVEGWDGYLDEFTDGWRDKDYRQLTDLFFLRKLRGSLLDVGCAVGDGIPLIASRCPRLDSISACDFSSRAVETAASRFNSADVSQHDVHRPFSRSWDNVICLQTIEHLDDPELAVRNLSAAANRNLIVGTPYKNRRPDADHRWSFDEADFVGIFDGYRIDRAALNIYYYRGPECWQVPAAFISLRVAVRRAQRRMERSKMGI